MSETKQRFSIRSGVPGYERQNAVIQAGYDTIDRMVTLVGDITLQDLFTQPFRDLVPRILPSVDLAASYGLIDRPAEVRECFERLQRVHGEQSFHSMAVYMADDDARLSRDYYSPTYKLSSWHGIHLPIFFRDPLKNEAILQAMDAVLEHAGDITTLDIYTLPSGKDTRLMKQVLHQGAQNWLIFEMNNTLCCSNNKCVLGTPIDNCTMAPSGTACAAGSSNCLGGGGK